MNQRVGIHFEPDRIEELPRLAPHPPFVHESRATKLATEENVRRDVEVVREVEFLVDERDAARERIVDATNLDYFTIEQNLATILPLHAREDFHERAFPRAVFADNGEHLAAGEREAHAPQRADTGKGFRQLSDFKQGRAHASHSVTSRPSLFSDPPRKHPHRPCESAAQECP